MAGCLLLAGCGPTPVSVRGNVTLNNQPLDEAVILFVPVETGRRKTSATITAGEYELELLPGSYRVEVADNPPLEVHPHGPGQPPAPRAARRPFPYHYTHNSPLTAEIVAGEPQEHSFKLSSAAPK